MPSLFDEWFDRAVDVALTVPGVTLDIAVLAAESSWQVDGQDAGEWCEAAKALAAQWVADDAAKAPTP